MPPQTPEDVARTMLSWHSLELVSCKILQTLWAGYGQICAISAKAKTDDAAKHLNSLCKLEGESSGEKGSTYPLILKLISAPPSTASGADGNESHRRKMLSYEVEQVFYTDIAPFLDENAAVAGCLASTRDMAGKEGAEKLDGLLATIMVDLWPAYPVAGGKRSVLTRIQVEGALHWLASFHSQSWVLGRWDHEEYVLPPLEESKRRSGAEGESGIGTGPWLNGGYTYLATRRSEYASLKGDTESEWSERLCSPVPIPGFDSEPMSIAEMAALVLTACGRPMESLIHGDVKSENLFTTADGKKVAFFDFQYVGMGLGVCDLAKLFTCSVPLDMLVDDDDYGHEELAMGDGERELLELYRCTLLKGQKRKYEWEELKRHWETALVDWCRFQASWGFWGNTEWLEARVRSILKDQEWRDWLLAEVENRLRIQIHNETYLTDA